MPLSILLQSNAPWVTSGYGGTTNNLANLWRQLGHRVGIFASYGIEGGFFEYDGFPIFPRGHQQWGSDVAGAHIENFGADVIITNIDTFVLNGYGNHKAPWIPITPVMEDPLTGGIKQSLAGARAIVSISRYGQETLKDAGFETTMIRLPLDTGKFFPLNKRDARATLGLPPDAFVIGNVGMNRGNRKGHELLLRAFTKVLVSIPHALLYIHTDAKQPDGLDLEDLVRTLGLTNQQVVFPSRYHAFYGKPMEWMNALYSAFSIYIQPSRNEGQAMPLWESCSAGNPIIGTDATALSEVLQDSEGIGLPVMNKGWLQGTGYYYETSEEAIASAILRAYERFNNNYVSAHNRMHAVRNVSLPVIGFQWQDFLLDLEKQLRFTPKTPQPVVAVGKDLHVIQASTLERNCGVGAYTRALVAGLEAEAKVQTMEIRTLTDAELIPLDTTIFHVQFEPSIEPPNGQLEKVMSGLKERGIKIIVTYHNVSDAINTHLNQQLADLCLIHWPNRAMQINDARVRVLGGMGVPVFNPPRIGTRVSVRKQFGFGPADKIISTFGFASIGRGHYELPQEIVGALTAQPSLKLQLIIPGNFMNEVGKNWVHQKIEEIRINYELQNQIIPIGNYLPDSEVILRLWMSDCGYLYLPCDTFSSSSALRYFIAARCPVVVTPSSHFGDVKRGVLLTDGFSLPEFCNAVLALAADIGTQDRLRREYEEVYTNWQWPKFAERTLALYKQVLES